MSLKKVHLRTALFLENVIENIPGLLFFLYLPNSLQSLICSLFYILRLKTECVLKYIIKNMNVIITVYCFYEIKNILNVKVL